MVLPSRIFPASMRLRSSERGMCRRAIFSSGSGWATPGWMSSGEEDLHGLGEEAGAGVVADEAGPAAGAEAGLFDELAFGGGERSFVGFDASGGELQQKLPGGVAVLALDEDGGVGGVDGGVDREDDDGAVVADDVAGAGDAAGFGDDVGGDGEDFSLEGDFGGEDFGYGGFCFGRHEATVSFCVGGAGGRI